jgi:pimeloyl-ACP methyl ester carboxylesterase
MAAQLDPHQPCVVGGASFGGFLALEMLPYLNAKGCVLIGAVRSPDEMPGLIRFFRPAHRLCRILPYEVFALMCGAVRLLLGPILPRTVRVFLELGTSLDPHFFRWATEAVLTWGEEGPMPTPDAPLHQVHGSRDRVIPVGVTEPDSIIQGGGHLISLSHPQQVNAWLRSVMDQHRTG